MKRHLFVSLAAFALVPHTTSVAQALRPAPAVEDEYVRYELEYPATNSFRVTYDVSAVTPGATSATDTSSTGMKVTDVSAIDLMTGAPLTFKELGGRIDVTLARPVPRGGQVRVRIQKMCTDARSYHADAKGVTFSRSLDVKRAAVVLPLDFELIGANVPVQVIQENDQRIAANFMNLYPMDVPLVIRARALARTAIRTAEAMPIVTARPPQAPADAPPRTVPMDQIRVTERAIQDREIVYFLKQPETHAFSLYHDYTASREGEHQYVNVVRTGSTVSDTSAMILDTGEQLKTRTLTGADIAREKIEIDERVDPDTEVVLIPFTPVKKGTSIRLRISETYTDPARYALIDGQLMWHRSFGRNRNDMVLPDGWYLTTSSIPAVISEEPDGRIRLSFWNGRPDNVDVFVKGSKR